MAIRTINSLADNSEVQELFSILKENGKDTAGLSALLSYVKQMEDFVKSAEYQIKDMKTQISEMTEIQKHPIKTALNGASQSLESNVSGVRAQLDKIRAGIVEACKNAITAFRENGITALDKLAVFFHIQQGFEAIQRNTTDSIKRCDITIGKIETFSREYHAANLHGKNLLRMLVGKEPLETPKEMGKLAKAMCAPYKSEKKSLNSIRETADKAISKLEELGKSADEIQQKRQDKKKLSIEEHIAEFEEKAKVFNVGKSVGMSEVNPKLRAEVVVS